MIKYIATIQNLKHKIYYYIHVYVNFFYFPGSEGELISDPKGSAADLQNAHPHRIVFRLIFLFCCN